LSLREGIGCLFKPGRFREDNFVALSKRTI